MHFAGSRILLPTVICLTTPVCLADSSAANGGADACRLGDFDLDFDGEDGCAALSLMQRRAHLTTNSHSTSESAMVQGVQRQHHSDSPAVEVGIKQALPADGKPASGVQKIAGAEASIQTRTGGVMDAAGLMPLSLLALQADLRVIDRNSILSKNVIIIFAPALLIVLIVLALVVCVVGQRMTGEQEIEYRSPGDSACESKAKGVLPSSVDFGRQSFGPGGSGAQRQSLSSLASSSGAGGIGWLLRADGNFPPAAFTPLKANVSYPVLQQVDKPQCLLFPTMAADVRVLKSFDVYWASLDEPWFRLDAKTDGSDVRIDLREASRMDDQLCATVTLADRKDSISSRSARGLLWTVTNAELNANTRGLAYRIDKQNNKVRNAVAAWGSTVAGTDAGDGWLKVGDWYLPMSVDGNTVLTRASSSEVASLQDLGIQIMRGDGYPYGSMYTTGSGIYSVVRNGASVCTMSINTGGFLLEAKLGNQKRVASVSKEQVNMHGGAMMLELCVEPEMDPVLMLMGCISVLRQLPPHGGSPAQGG